MASSKQDRKQGDNSLASVDESWIKVCCLLLVDRVHTMDPIGLNKSILKYLGSSLERPNDVIAGYTAVSYYMQH